MLLADFDWNGLTWLLFWVFVFGGGSAVVTLINSLAKHWRKVKESEHLAALKQGLVERGLSMEEIERIVRAAPEPQDVEVDEAPAVQLTRVLAEHMVPPEAMGEILHNFQACGDPTTQRTLADMIQVLCENSAKPEHILGAVRAMLGTYRPAQSCPPEEHGATDATASFRR